MFTFDPEHTDAKWLFASLAALFALMTIIMTLRTYLNYRGTTASARAANRALRKTVEAEQRLIEAMRPDSGNVGFAVHGGQAELRVFPMATSSGWCKVCSIGNCPPLAQFCPHCGRPTAGQCTFKHDARTRRTTLIDPAVRELTAIASDSVVIGESARCLSPSDPPPPEPDTVKGFL